MAPVIIDYKPDRLIFHPDEHRMALLAQPAAEFADAGGVIWGNVSPALWRPIVLVAA